MWVTAGAVAMRHYSGRMPASTNPERLLGLGHDLEQLRAVARNGADEVLDHFPEVGDRQVQTALDGLLEQFADTLRAIDAEAEELAGRLRIAAQSSGPPRPGSGRAAAGADDVAAPVRKGMFR